MKHFITIAISLLLAVSSAIAQGRALKTPAARKNLERAEQLADRFVQRFRETLDFEVVYREFFIVDPEKRLLNSSSIVFDSLERHEEIKKKISPSETEQAYIGFMNLYYLVGIYMANVSTVDEESSTIKSKELFPPELLKAMKEPSTCFFFIDYLENKSCKDIPELFQTAEDVRQFAKNANYLAALFRKYIPSEPFNSPKYKAHIEQLDWDGRETSIDERNDLFGTGEETTKYQVYRELFVLDIVEENGEMKVARIPIGN
ncbi:MAG: hypothetical protein H0U54_16570 [Acidobacteria bacterium]|nr:hypothetical protein [Acidobacteriota bacterium]